MLAMRCPCRLVLAAWLTAGLTAQQPPATPTPAMPVTAGSELRDTLVRHAADRGSLGRRYAVTMSPLRGERLGSFLRAELAALERIDVAGLSPGGRLDALMLGDLLRHELARLGRAGERDREVASLLPYWRTVADLAEARAAVEPVDPAAAAAAVSGLAEDADAARRALPEIDPPRPLAGRAAERLAGLRRDLGEWFEFRDGYDPLFTWWVRTPYRAAAAALERHEEALRDHVGRDPSGAAPIVGDPIGRAALVDELRFERIPYSPEELVGIAEREFAWCDEQMAEAAAALGFEGDGAWRAAQDAVKDRHAAPGGQPALIRALAEEAVAFLEARDLLTIPPLAKETWRMRMMSVARQLVSPYFTGGEVISVSFPTAAMEHADKRMSLRGNNEHFARATVHHELIPGHHLQQFMARRHATWRRPFATPFWLEGWALYWEMRLYDLGLPQTPEDRIGFLFWRKHRCARIVFSLRFHLGTMSAMEAVDYLVDRVGHERRNAEAEVRRSVAGAYGPLYQAAYMIGGLQLRALHRELVTGGAWSERAFHDAVLRNGSMPIERLRSLLRGEVPAAPAPATWRFADDHR